MNSRWPGIGRAWAAGSQVLWTPLDLPGLYSWHEAWDPLTVTVDGSQRVTQWSDKSGAGRHYTQGNTANMATFDSGKKALTRATNGGMMLMTNDTSNQPTATTLAYIMETAAASAANAVFTKGSAPWGSPGFYVDNMTMLHWNGSAMVFLNADAANPILAVLRHGAAGGTAYTNGVSSPTGNNPQPLPFVPLSVTVPRGILRWDRIGGPSEVDFNGDLYCIIESSQVVSDADRERLEGYMAHGAGKTALLPANHPYKSAPPTK
jgi:hypothetical protein